MVFRIRFPRSSIFFTLSALSLGIFPTTLATAAPVPTTENLQVDVNGFTPSLYQGRGDLKVTINLKNTTGAFLNSPSLSVYSTAEAISLKNSWTDWTSANKELPEPHTKLLSSLTLPSILPNEQAELKITIPESIANQAFRKSGAYGILLKTHTYATSSTSASAKSAAQRVKEWQANGGNKPSILKTSGATYTYEAVGEIDLNKGVKPDFQAKIFKNTARTILPYTSEKTSSKLLPLNLVRFTSKDFSHPNPSTAAKDRVEKLLSLAHEANVLTVVDPSLFQYSSTKAPEPDLAAAISEFYANSDNYLNVNSPSRPPTKNPALSKTPEPGETPSPDNHPGAITPEDRQRTLEPSPAPLPLNTEGNSTKTPDSPIGTPSSPEIPQKPNIDNSWLDLLTSQQQVLVPSLKKLQELPAQQVALLPWATPSWIAGKWGGPPTTSLANSSLTFTEDFKEKVLNNKSTTSSTTLEASKTTPIFLPFLSEDAPALPDLKLPQGTPLIPLIESNQLDATNQLSHNGLGSLEIGKESYRSVVIDSLAATLLQRASDSGLDYNSRFTAQQALLGVAAGSLETKGHETLLLALPLPSDPEHFKSALGVVNTLKQQVGAEQLSLDQVLNLPFANQKLTLHRNENLVSDNPNDAVFGPATIRPTQAESLKVNLARLHQLSTTLSSPQKMMEPLEKSALFQLSRVPGGVLTTWQDSLAPYWNPFVLSAPKSVLMIYGDSALPVQVTNTLPWTAHINLELESRNPRLASPGITKTSLTPSSPTTAYVKLRGVGSGDIKATIIAFNDSEDSLAKPVSLIVNVRANWERTGVLFIGGLCAAILIFGIARRVKKGRRVTPQDIVQATAYEERRDS
ncbi:hypothetical protein KRX54_01700 [Actinomycetaceae bacterium TAE3-ERU4]|nr:hypothetical protein [Actinomycetaceae bacterium TAE3-ERU4]